MKARIIALFKYLKGYHMAEGKTRSTRLHRKVDSVEYYKKRLNSMDSLTLEITEGGGSPLLEVFKHKLDSHLLGFPKSGSPVFICLCCPYTIQFSGQHPEIFLKYILNNKMQIKWPRSCIMISQTMVRCEQIRTWGHKAKITAASLLPWSCCCCTN